MKEHIYTIPINEHFGKLEGCPLCSLFDMMEFNEIDAITGAAMMEPAVRVKTNEQGFCDKHYGMIFQYGKKLPVALILETHLDELYESLIKKKGDGQAKLLADVEKDCYVCRRINANMTSLYSNIFYLYRTEEKFRELFAKQKYFCLPHYREMLQYAQKELSKKEFSAFSEAASKIEMRYLEELRSDIKWFCKKFDYRFKDEDWKNSRDAIERAMYTISGKRVKNDKQS